MPIFKLLHILSMVGAVTLLVGTEVFVTLAIWRRDVRGLATIFRLTRSPSPTTIGGILLLAGVAFGLLAAATGAIDFFAGWLIAAYVLVIALVVANVSPQKRQVRQVAQAAVDAEEGRRSVDEVVGQMATVPIALYFATNVVLFAALIADMVLKPF